MRAHSLEESTSPQAWPLLARAVVLAAGGPTPGSIGPVDVAVETGLTSLGTESATGDFNEDGWDDLVTLHPWEDAASFMPFDHLSDLPDIPGGAVFGTPTTLATVPNPTAAVAADVDGDGHLDLVVIGEMDRAFVHLGDGSGGFDWKVIPVSLPGIPTMLERIDVDVDGQHELVFAAADYLLIASRNESGGFEFESIPVNGEIRAVATNPFDGPAKLAVIDVNVINVVAKIEVLGGFKNTEQDVPPGLDDAVALAAGESHVAALTPEGEVVCWGWNGFGQCDVPDDLDQVVAIACGANFTLALEVDGDVRGWGDMDDYGPPNPPGDLGRAVEIAAGRNHAVALEEDGTVRCWGVDDGGQCDVPSFEFLYQIDAGKDHSIGLDGYFEAVCWGANQFGQCDVPYGQTYSKVAVGGFHSIGLKSNGTVHCWGWNTDNQCDVPPGETFTEVVGGWYHTIGLRPDGTAVCWGRNAFNQCNVPPGETFTQVDGGYNFSIGLRPNGTVAEWGSWTGNPINETFIQIAAGGQHRIGLRSNGTAFCWGSNSSGQCDVPPGETFVRVDAGDNHSIGIRPDGTAVCWGSNSFGQCNVPEGESFYQIAGGQYHSIGLRLDGIPVGWGWNGYGQRDMGLGRSVGIGAGDEFTCAIGAENGYVRCWGAMDNPLGVFVDVAGGGSHVAGIKHDGGLKCWGNNNEGQAPGWGGEYLLDVDAGGRNTVAREWDGTLLCWGSNRYGQCDIPVNMLPVKALASSNYATIVATREETAEQSVRMFEFDVESTLPGDINNDGQVNGADLGLMLAAWGPCVDPSNCPADLNGDGTVDGADLGTLLASWTG